MIVAAGILLFGVQFSTAHLGWLALTCFLTMAALYGMGKLFAMHFLFFRREAWHLTNLRQERTFLPSRLNFPARALGPWIAFAASITPLTQGLDAMRQLLFPQNTQFGFLSVGAELAILTALCIVMIGAARISLQRLEMLSRREGRLTDRRR